MSTIDSVAAIIRKHQTLDGSVVRTIHQSLAEDATMEDVVEAIELLYQSGHVKRHVNMRTSDSANAVDKVIWIGE